MKASTTKWRFWQVAIVVVAMATCWCWFAFGAPYTLYTKEQLVLFVADCTAVLDYFARPAVLSSIVGDYLTQFYLLICGGATILTIVAALLWWGVRSALRRFDVPSQNATVWALLPVVAEVALNCHVEYPLAMTLGAVAATWSFVAWARMGDGVCKWLLAMLLAVVLYWAVGAHAMMFVVLSVAWLCRQRRWGWALTLMLLAVVAEMVVGRMLYLPASQAYCYPLIENYMFQHCQLFLLTEAAVVVALIGIGIRRAWIGALVVVMASIAGVAAIFDDTMEYWLGMSCEYYFNRKERILERADENWERKSYVATYYTNLVLAERGELGEYLTENYQPATYGLLLDVDESSGYCYAMAAADATAAIGDMAEAQRATLLAMTFSPHQRSSRVAKKMVEIAMTVGDKELAEKFLWQLERTALHREWAAKRRAELMSGAVPSDEVRANLVEKDGFVGANNWYPALYALVEANGANRMAVDYLLSMHLLRKDRQRFLDDYERYFYPRWGAQPPKVYQQALMMSFDDESELMEAIERYGISAEVQRDCIDYSRIYVSAGGRGEALQERFSRTYWFYCNYAQMN